MRAGPAPGRAPPPPPFCASQAAPRLQSQVRFRPSTGTVGPAAHSQGLNVLLHRTGRVTCAQGLWPVFTTQQLCCLHPPVLSLPRAARHTPHSQQEPRHLVPLADPTPSVQGGEGTEKAQLCRLLAV